MFSTAGATAMSGRSGASCLMVAMAEMTVQAPVLSIFISSIRSAGLMLMPPESKQTPLPTMASSRPRESAGPPSPLRMTMKRGVLSVPRPTAMNMPMPSAVGLLRPEDVDLQAVLLGEVRGLVGEDLRADVVGRSVRERPGVVGALADDPAALGGLRSGPRRRHRARRG